MKNIKKNNYYSFVLGGLFLLLIPFAFIVDWLPRYPDAFGYLADANYFVQSPFLWSDITENMNSYYAYGCSIILSFFFLCFKSYNKISKAIFIFNVLTIIGIYFILVKIAERLLNEFSSKLRCFVCFTICLYPSYIYQVYVVSPELLTILLNLFIVYCIIKIEENSRCKLIYIFLIGSFIPYMVALHGRNLGLWFITMLIMVLMFIKKEITLRQFICYMLVTTFGIIFYKYVNDNVKANVYMLNNISSINNSSVSVLNNLLKIFTLKGLKNILTAVFTQLFYLGSTTFLLYFVGLFSSIFELSIKFKKYVNNKRLNLELYDFAKLYIIMSSLGILILSAALFQEPRRLDQVLYGRHNEMMIPTIMILGVYYLSKHVNINKALKYLLIMYIFLIFCSLLTFKMLTIHSFETSIPRAITAIYLFYNLILNNPYSLFIVVMLIFYFIILYIFLQYKSNTNSKYYIVAFTILIVYIITSYKAIKAEYEDNLKFRSPYWKFEEILDYDNLKIYAVKIDGLNNSYNYLLQLMSMKNKVNIITKHEIENIDTGSNNDCGIIYTDKAINADDMRHFYKIQNVLENVKGEVWVYGEEYIEYLSVHGYTF